VFSELKGELRVSAAAMRLLFLDLFLDLGRSWAGSGPELG
jgi:hypothetical protein